MTEVENQVEKAEAIGQNQIEEQQPSSSLPEQQQQQQAYDPETKEINWDCPCLAGMADPNLPCTPQFKAAFSCFVYSPDSSDTHMKGSECVELFKQMQDCFMKNPEAYSDQLRDDDEDEDNNVEESNEQSDAPSPSQIDKSTPDQSSSVQTEQSQ